MKVEKLIVYFFFLSLPLLCYNVQAKNDDPFTKIGIQIVKHKTKVPDFCLKCLDGKDLRLKDFNGKVVFINFWATWCGPCKEEMPSMEALYREFKDRGFVLLAISVDYGGTTFVKEFIANHHYTFPVLLDPSCKTLHLYQVKGIPTMLIIDREGKWVGRAVGPRNWGSSDAKSTLNLLLQR
jgi:peroxiredoxin